jgi:NAD(P)-dependent dehydrogenase (short-subunit alcohol dehydrogenase family)
MARHPGSIEAHPRGNRVAGKVAIITGGGSGIGRAAAELLAKEGAAVVVATRSPEKGEETIRRIRATGGDVRFIPTDVTREEDCVALVARTVEAYGRLDVLVNNAAIYPRNTLETTSLAFWREIMATNLDGPFLLCREAVPHMLRAGGGSIINVGSSNGLAGGANLTAYSVSKGGLLTLTRNIAAAYASQGIRANYLIPGWVLTDTERAVQAREGHDAAWLAERAQSLAGGRFSTPEDGAYAILFLASDESCFVNGTMLNTDGGASMVSRGAGPGRPAPRPEPPRPSD